MEFENSCGFVHLHNHTMYSLLDGAVKPADLINTAKEWGMGAVAITDHGNMFGAVEFYLKARKAGIRPIIGSEVYVAIEGRHVRQAARGNIDGANHLVLLAKNGRGYRNLMKLVSKGYTEGFYYKPRIDRELLREYGEGLIATSACLGGEVQQLILQGHPKEAERVALGYVDIFGEGNFYLELQDHGIPEEKQVVRALADMSAKTGIPLIATNDCHYLKKEHAGAHDVLLCISTGKILTDENRMRMETEEFYLKTPDEMKALFADHPGAIENTVSIAERCEVEIETGVYHPVKFDIPVDFEGDTNDYLRKVAGDGLVMRYGERADEYRERLDYELDTIIKMGFADYFLALYDCTNAARELDVPVGTARGSAGGSIVAYSLGITNLDPMAYDLIFERFLNPERVSMPDIDIDYADRDRGKMIDYVKRKYGEDHVCQIITFGTMKARAVIRDVGRVLDMPYGDVDKIAKLIPTDPKMTIDDALDIVPELRELEGRDETHRTLFAHARVLEGLARHAGTHAAGVIITPEPCTNFLPLYKPTNEDITSQYTMEYVETIGCLKVDFLGLRTLTVIKDAVEMAQNSGANIDIDAIPKDDPAVYELMGRGETIGVFQFESGGMREYLKKLRPAAIEDLIAMNALYRPGPLGSNMVDDFIERSHGTKKITYPHPLLEPILEETHGVIVYQEQVMKIANIMAGFSLGAADQLRRAMGKKKVDVMAQMKHTFVEGARERDIDPATASEVFDLMAHFAGYGFNKSHSAGYAILAYQTAWLKAHFPAEFMAATLTSEMDNTDRIVTLIEECRRMDIEVLPPDVNRSYTTFTVDGGNVRFGLAGIKNVGYGAIETIVQTREQEGPFTDIFDFCSRVDLRSLNKRMLEALVMAGGFDCFGESRARLMAGLDDAVEIAHAAHREKEMGQFNLFGEGTGAETVFEAPTLPDVPQWPTMTKLANEKSVLGFWFSGHPLQQYEDEMKAFTTPFSRLYMKKDRAPVTVGGVITAITRKNRKKDNKPYMRMMVEDLEGSGEVMLMNGAFDDYKDTVAVDTLVLINGTVGKSDNGEQPTVFANAIEPLENARAEKTHAVTITLSTTGLGDGMLDRITDVCEKHPGTVPLWIKLATASAGTYSVKANRYAVSPDRNCIRELRGLLGRENAWIS